MCHTAGLTLRTARQKAFSPGLSALLLPHFLNIAGSSAIPELISDQSPALPAPHVFDQMITDVIVSGWERLLSGTEMQVGVRVSGTFLPIVSALPDHLNRLRRPPKWWMSYGSTRNSIPPLPKNTRNFCYLFVNFCYNHD